MTVIELARDTRDTDLTDEEKRARARADWLADPANVTGPVLAQRYGMSDPWARKQIRAARRERDGAVTPPVTVAPPPVRKPRPAVTPDVTPEVPTATPWPLRLCRDVGSVVVIAVCAVVSYTHIRSLAVTAGMDSASWVPLGIDGLMAVTTCSLMIDKRAGRRPLRAAQIGLALGIAGTLVANALASEPELVPLLYVRIALACYPPAAVAVVLHLVCFRAGDR